MSLDVEAVEEVEGETEDTEERGVCPFPVHVTDD